MTFWPQLNSQEQNLLQVDASALPLSSRLGKVWCLISVTENVSEKLNIRLVPAEARSGLLTAEETKRLKKLHEDNRQFLRIPRRSVSPVDWSFTCWVKLKTNIHLNKQTCCAVSNRTAIFWLKESYPTFLIRILTWFPLLRKLLEWTPSIPSKNVKILHYTSFKTITFIL